MNYKTSERWYSSRVECDMPLVRWGHYGTPVMLFPTAGGDAEEVERCELVGALWPLIESGRIKVYSTDSIAGGAWISGHHSPEYCSRLQLMYDEFVYNEVVPAIRADCRSTGIEVIAAGASIGALNAVATLCRHPDAFRLAIAMSGTFDLSQYLHGNVNMDFYYWSPLHYLPDLEGEQLDLLRRRFVVLATGEGDYENPGESWRMADVLGRKGIPNRVDLWGWNYRHDWPTWHEMLPRYLNEYA